MQIKTTYVNKHKTLYSLLAVSFLVLFFVACAGSRQRQAITSSGYVLEKDYLLVEATKYASFGDLLSALSLINQAVKYDSVCAGCHYLRAMILTQGGRPKDALESIEKAHLLDPTNRWYTILNAQVNTRVGSIDSAIVLYHKLVEQEGYNTEIYFNLVELYGVKNELPKVQALLDTIEKHDSYSEALALVRQQLYYRTGETAKALAEAEELDRISPNNPQYLTLIGDIYVRMGDVMTAKPYYDNALQVDSTYIPAQFGLLDVYRKAESFTSFFDELAKLSSNDRIDLGEKLNYLTLVVSDPILAPISRQPLDKILKDMSLTYSKRWAFVYFYLSFLMQGGQVDDAISVMNTYVVNGESLPTYEAWGAYLSLLHGASRWSDLVAKADEGMKLFKKDIPLSLYKSVGLWQLGHLKGAADVLNDALKLKPDSTQRYDIYLMLGDLYHAMGNAKKLFASYDKALEIKPDGVAVLNNYAYYLSERSERLDKALVMSKKAVDAEPNNPTYLDTFGWVYYKLGMYSEAKNVFRQAIVYGGRTMSVLLDHYGDVLFALNEYATAIVYWEFALEAKDCENSVEIKQKIEKTKPLNP